MAEAWQLAKLNKSRMRVPDSLTYDQASELLDKRLVTDPQKAFLKDFGYKPFHFDGMTIKAASELIKNCKRSQRSHRSPRIESRFVKKVSKR